MLHYDIIKDPITQEEWIETHLFGKELLTYPLLNKDTAFSQEERLSLGLLGKLPLRIETIEEQLTRSYLQLRKYSSHLKKHIYLNDLRDKNEVLFYKIISEHFEELLPVIYTPGVGEAVKEFMYEYRQPRGLFISYPEQDKMETILNNRTHKDVSVILVTDGERILGMGDQGICGMPIPIAKLSLYTICAGVNPHHTLPILLDVGTNNANLLNHPLYLGWTHPRIEGEEYDVFIEKFIQAVKKCLPNAYLHWEDFGRENARRNLERYRETICSFNDDMQGTGAVTLAALLSAVFRLGKTLSEQTIAILGAGTAGVGIADQIVSAMMREGTEINEARSKIWLIDRDGLLSEHMNLISFQKPYARAEGGLGLEAVVKKAKPTVLIGCSSNPNAFNEAIVRDMLSYTDRPIIFPLSNPNSQSEANPIDLLHWTDGKALVATGSPFDVQKVAQCNNALIYPGIGLGVITAKAKQVNDNMLWAACSGLAEFSPKGEGEPILPLLTDAQKMRSIAKRIACKVIQCAYKDGLTELNSIDNIEALIDKNIWSPVYRRIAPHRPAK